MINQGQMTAAELRVLRADAARVREQQRDAQVIDLHVDEYDARWQVAS